MDTRLTARAFIDATFHLETVHVHFDFLGFQLFLH